MKIKQKPISKTDIEGRSSSLFTLNNVITQAIREIRGHIIINKTKNLKSFA